MEEVVKGEESGKVKENFTKAKYVVDVRESRGRDAGRSGASAIGDIDTEGKDLSSGSSDKLDSAAQ